MLGRLSVLRMRPVVHVLGRNLGQVVGREVGREVGRHLPRIVSWIVTRLLFDLILRIGRRTGRTVPVVGGWSSRTGVVFLLGHDQWMVLLTAVVF